LVPVLNPQSPEAHAIATIFMYFLVLAAIIFLVVATMVGYSIVRYRARQGDADPRPSFGHRRIEITWTVVPLVIVLGIFVFTLRTMANVDAPLEPDRPPDLTITGHQWWWEARYPNGATTAREIHIPAGRRLLVRIESADVIHDFWVPQLARKMDAVPGRTGYIWLRADNPGTYQGACSEFCGMQHAGMRFEVVAEPEADFSAWIARQAETPAPDPGERLFRERKCADCHAISASDATPRIGPPLTHIASRKYLGGNLPNTPGNLTSWITSPQSILPGNRMPDSRVPADELQELTRFLETRR
jgi:cytochrome c oxidase subunit II